MVLTDEGNAGGTQEVNAAPPQSPAPVTPREPLWFSRKVESPDEGTGFDLDGLVVFIGVTVIFFTIVFMLTG